MSFESETAAHDGTRLMGLPTDDAAGVAGIDEEAERHSMRRGQPQPLGKPPALRLPGPALATHTARLTPSSSPSSSRSRCRAGALPLPDSEVDNVVKRSMLSHRHKARLVVGGRVDRAELVGPCGEPPSNGLGQDSVDGGVVDALKKGEDARVGHVC